MDLDEKDVRSVANGRFTRRWRWHFTGYLIFCLVLMIGIVLGNIYLGWMDRLVFIPLVMLLGGFGFWIRRLDKAEKKLVKEWKGE